MLALLTVVSALVSYERMEFDMKYGPIPAGSAVMEVRREGEKYLATSKAVSNKFFSLFFPVDDSMESLMDVEGFPKRFEKATKEGRHRSYHEAIFLQDEGKIISDGDTLSVRRPVQDPLSIFYYLRLRPLKVGTTFSVYTFTDGKLYPLKVKVVGKEKVRVKAGTFDCFVLVPSRTTGGLLKRGRMKVWLSDDERRLLVKMRSELAIGHISAELVRYEREE